MLEPEIVAGTFYNPSRLGYIVGLVFEILFLIMFNFLFKEHKES